MPTTDHQNVQRHHYSKDLKDRVIYQRHTLGRTTTQIAKDLDMPLRVVQRVLQLYDEIGRVVRDPKAYAKQGRARLLDVKCSDFVLALIDRHPDIYLDEIADQLLDQQNVSVSLATVQRTLKLLGITGKKLSKDAAEPCEEARQRYLYKVGKEPAWRLVFCGESSVNMHTTFRTNGWAAKGKRRARVPTYFQREDRYSILPALTVDGYIYSDIVHGSFNGYTFKIFLQGLLEEMNPYPEPKSVLVMDNSAIHHVEGIQEMCDERGVKIIYLPPYSPDYNPVEESFSFVKGFIRHHGSRFRAEISTGQKDRPYLFLYEAMNAVTTEHARDWFSHSGYI